MKSLYQVMRSIWRRIRRRRWLVLGSTCFIAIIIIFMNSNNFMQSVRYEADFKHDLFIHDSGHAIENVSAMTMSDHRSSQPIEEVSSNSYIGLDEHDVLSLFEGPPHDDKVIRSFFQIDVKYLESSLPPEVVEQLYKGIQVTNLSEYNSVLSTFSDYAITISEEVMRQLH